MAYLRKINISYKRPLPPNALTSLLKYSKSVKEFSTGVKIARRFLGLKKLHYSYWAIAESYREGNKVKSRTLYSFGKLQRKPSVAFMKREAIRLRTDLKKYADAMPDDRFSYEYKKLSKLEEAILKLNDKRWKN